MLIFHARMNNKAVVIVAKDADVFSFLIHALGQLECFLPPWYTKIAFNQLISFNMIHDNLGSEISNLLFPKCYHR